MAAESGVQASDQPRPSDGRLLLAVTVLVGFTALLMFGGAGTVDWPMAWVYTGYVFAFTFLHRRRLVRLYPDLGGARLKGPNRANVQPFDRVLMPLLAVMTQVVPLVAGLDKRFGWTGDMALGVQLGAFALIVIVYAFSGGAMFANRYFSSVVRIQADRGHTVVSSGPYRLIRHPNYAALIAGSALLPVLLGTLAALIPAAGVAIVVVIRTAFEDRALREHLPGYREYAARVRYRLLPGVW